MLGKTGKGTLCIWCMRIKKKCRMTEELLRGTKGVRRARRVEKGAEIMLEAEMGGLTSVMRKIDKLEKRMEKRFEEMGRGFDHRLASVVEETVSGVLTELADLSYGRLFKETWRPEEMELEEEEYQGLDWRREVGELRAEAIEVEQGGRVRAEELKKVSEEFEEEDKEGEEEEGEGEEGEEEEGEEEEEEEEEHEDGEDDSRDGYLEGGGDLEATSLSEEE